VRLVCVARCVPDGLAADAPPSFWPGEAAAESGWRRGGGRPAGGWCLALWRGCVRCFASASVLPCWPWRSVTPTVRCVNSRASPRWRRGGGRPIGALPCEQAGLLWCRSHTGSARGLLEALLDQAAERHRRSSAANLCCSSSAGAVLGEAACCPPPLAGGLPGWPSAWGMAR